MSRVRPPVLRRRDLHVSLIVGSIAACNIVTGVFSLYMVRGYSRSVRRDMTSISNVCDTVKSYCSNVVDFVYLYASPESKSQSMVLSSENSADCEERDDDPVGVLGYGQTKSKNHIWIYRDDMLRSGQSRRVYLRKVPIARHLFGTTNNISSN